MSKLIARVFPAKTRSTPEDEHAYFGMPPFIEGLPKYDEVHISVVFSWHMSIAKELKKQWEVVCPVVKIGGPAAGSYAGEFCPDLYLSNATITSRGCPNKCKWCLVPEREGKLRELENVHPHNIVQDNNLLACSKPHRRKVYAMLREFPRKPDFCGGFEARRLTQWDVDELATIGGKPQLTFACDVPQALKPLQKAMNLLKDLPRRYKRCYVMLGNHTNETLEEAEQRCIEVWKAGSWPKALLYIPIGQENERLVYDEKWWELKRRWWRSELVASHGELIDAGKEDEIFRGGDWDRKPDERQLGLPMCAD